MTDAASADAEHDEATSTRARHQRSNTRSPLIHMPTLVLSTGVSAFLFTAVMTLGLHTHGQLVDRLEAMSTRMNDIPTRDELGKEIEQVAQIQRATWEASAAQVQASADVTSEAVRGIEAQVDRQRELSAMLNDRISSLDERIASLGRDFSGALIEYFESGANRGGNEGGAGELDEVYRDYAIQIVTRDGGMTSREAIRFVDRAFLHPRGAEARRLVELVQSARQNHRTVIGAD